MHGCSFVRRIRRRWIVAAVAAAGAGAASMSAYFGIVPLIRGLVWQASSTNIEASNVRDVEIRFVGVDPRHRLKIRDRRRIEMFASLLGRLGGWSPEPPPSGHCAKHLSFTMSANLRDGGQVAGEWLVCAEPYYLDYMPGSSLKYPDPGVCELPPEVANEPQVVEFVEYLFGLREQVPKSAVWDGS